jgi:hypothetical protein
MVLSISPGPAPISEAEFFEKYAQMWRISDDFWNNWKLLRRQFDYARDWAPHVGKTTPGPMPICCRSENFASPPWKVAAQPANSLPMSNRP